MNRKNLYGKIAAFAALILIIGTINFSTNGGAIKANDLEVSLIKTEPVPLQTGEYADVWVKVTNEGELIAKNSVLKLKTDFPFSADPDEDLVREMGKVYPGVEHHAHFQVRVSENAVQGENMLKFELSPSEGISITEDVPVQIRTDETALIINSVETKPSTINPSKTGEITFNLKNLADSYLKNIDVSIGLDSEDIPLVPVGSTTMQRIQKIAPGNESEITYQIKADSDATPQAYKVPIKLDYENEAGTSFSTEQYTGIIVGGQPELETNLIETEILRSGASGEVSLSIVNRGLTLAKFLNLEVQEGDSYEVISSPTVYIGDMASDDYESASFRIYVEEGVDTVEIPLELKYKDSEGEKKSEIQTVSFRTYNQDEISRMNLLDQNNYLSYILVLVIVLAALYGAYRYWKSKKEKILEE